VAKLTLDPERAVTEARDIVAIAKWIESNAEDFLRADAVGEAEKRRVALAP
jgi:hypothetical protein